LCRYAEGAAPEGDDEGARWVGVCAADCATGRFLVGCAAVEYKLNTC
jgi:hypothetical protein